MSDVDSTQPAGASSTPAPTPSGSVEVGGGKRCSACARCLHSSAYSGTQSKAPAKTRKCMECVVQGRPSLSEEALAAAAAGASSGAASGAASAEGGSSASAAPVAAAVAPKKKSKANTPGAIARERAAARQAAAAAANGGKSSASATPSSSSSAASSSQSSSSNERVSLESQLLAKARAKGGRKADSIFSAPRKSKDQSGKRGLLDDDDEWFLPDAERCLTEVFRRFDSSHASDASVPAGDLRWTLADTQSFARATNGKDFSTQELMEIQDNLEHDEQGRLTLKGFLSFYHLQTSAHPEETRKDLKKLGYDDNLQLKVKA